MGLSRQAGMILFRIVIPLIYLAIQFLLYRGASRWAAAKFPGRKNISLLVAVPFLFFTLLFFGLAMVRVQVLQLPDWLREVAVYPSSFWTGATLFLGLVETALLILILPLKLGVRAAGLVPSWKERMARLRAKPSMQRFDASRRAFIRRGAYGLTAVSFAGSAYGLLAAKHEHEVTEEEFAVRNLPPAFDGFTITLLSDIHSSVYMSKTDMDGFVALANGLKSDMIVVPGDFVSGLTEEVYPFAESFSNLQAPHGVYGVTGNHEYYTQDPDRVIREVDACGVKLLHEECVSIKKNGSEILVVGIDDAPRGQIAARRIRSALSRAVPGAPRILLCHRPYYLAEAEDLNIDLVLSGHTHGGQVVLGRFGNTVITPASLASPYVWGRYRKGGTEMYVSRGIGTVGLPIRINCPSEITRITLRAAAPHTAGGRPA